MVKFHQMTLKEITKELETGSGGLNEEKALKRLKLDGPNLLQAPKKENPLMNTNQAGSLRIKPQQKRPPIEPGKYLRRLQLRIIRNPVLE